MASTKANTFFSEGELTELKELFDQHDSNKDGLVNTIELLQLTRSLDEPATSEEVQCVIELFDTDKDGSLNYNEFLSLMEKLRSLD
ncbi:phospholipid scramblase 1 [Mortierella sp. GBA30]|nr:phospholipid scramblase 1 [Mortierella sp. GBA30]